MKDNVPQVVCCGENVDEDSICPFCGSETGSINEDGRRR